MRRSFRPLVVALVVGLLGVIAPAAAEAATLPGIDVAKYQGSIAWGSVASGGIRFAFIKATEGADREDVTPRAASRLALGATQDRTHAGAQFARIEGFGEIVVGAELEAENTIDCVAPRRQHQHRQPRVRATQFAQ